MNNLNCLSHWYPKLVDAGLPTPLTQIVLMPTEVQKELYQVFDGLPAGKAAIEWINSKLLPVVNTLGPPCFLRTGQTSNKHGWKNTCHITPSSNLLDHVLALAEFSEICDFMGLPWDVWVVREMLPTFPQMVADRYGDMPVCREFRYFVQDGAFKCWHPYWPEKALRDGISELPPDFNERYQLLCKMPDNTWETLHDLASRAGAAVGGYWSVDILETKRGWFVTDMAIGERSWHWPGCKFAPQGEAVEDAAEKDEFDEFLKASKGEK